MSASSSRACLIPNLCQRRSFWAQSAHVGSREHWEEAQTQNHIALCPHSSLPSTLGNPDPPGCPLPRPSKETPSRWDGLEEVAPLPESLLMRFTPTQPGPHSHNNPKPHLGAVAGWSPTSRGVGLTRQNPKRWWEGHSRAPMNRKILGISAPITPIPIPIFPLCAFE